METHLTESDRLARQFRNSMTGPAWHGPSVFENLEGVTAKDAAAKPPGAKSVHSIWEIVLHVTAWQQEGLRCVLGADAYNSLEGEADWPRVPSPHGEEAWAQSMEALRTVSQKLAQAIEALPAAALNNAVPGRDWDFYFLLHGIVQHNLYHAGQIGILKRMLRST